MRPIVAVTGIPRVTIANAHPTYEFHADQSIWDVRIIYAEHSPGFDECWKSVKQLLDEVEASECKGLHVLAFHKSEQTLARFRDRIEPYHRFRLLDRDALKHYGSALFTSYVNAILDEEKLWRDKVRPDSRRHPLLLPENCFSAPPALRDAWKRARKANSARDIDSVGSMLVGFGRLHKENNAYHDMKEFRFNYLGNHGKPPTDALNWKICYRFPDRMHYDVNRVDGREPFDFSLGGVSRRFGTHANVSPHGVLV